MVVDPYDADHEEADCVSERRRSLLTELVTEMPVPGAGHVQI
jgi:hypothetical protein